MADQLTNPRNGDVLTSGRYAILGRFPGRMVIAWASDDHDDDRTVIGSDSAGDFDRALAVVQAAGWREVAG